MRELHTSVKAAELIAPTLRGRSFVLVMAHPTGNPTADEDDRDFILAPRDLLPCWGELRKYKDTHGKDYTRPEDNYHPRDLYQPFPAGVPCAVVINRKQFTDGLSKEFTDVFNEVLKEGPWTGLSEVSLTKENIVVKCHDKTEGLRLDSTELVSFLAFCTGLSGKSIEWYKSTREFLTVREAVFSHMSQKNTPLYGLNGENQYYFAHRSPYRILNGIPRGLSEGSFGDGFDYNRKRLQDVFAADNSDLSFDIREYITSKGEFIYDNDTRSMKGDTSVENYCKLFKEGLYQALEKEMESLGISEEEKAA